MTPLEINKEIAEIIFGAGNYFSSQVFPSIAINPKVNGKGYALNLSLIEKNWAENISDAWQLFEENPETYVKKIQYYADKKTEYECVFRNSDLNVIGSAKADTAPMAICLAWLNWSKNK